MFSFDGEHEVLERDVIIEDMEQKYHDKYMIVINGHGRDCRLRGDIIAILTPEEYSKLEKPKPMLPKYSVWEGFSLQLDGLGAYGFYL
ncbi:MAG: hypothetical protein FWG65_08715 [Turicibacter sp.]|nr:hypothetical protein [Turicibacter sp.]